MPDHVKELLSSYIDNEVSDEEKEIIHQHLNNCEECREYLYELQLLRENIFYAYENIEAPNHLENRILARIDEIGFKQSKTNALMGWMAGLFAILILTGLAVLVVPSMHMITKLATVFSTVMVKMLYTVPIIVSAVPYLAVILYALAFIVIAIASWFLYRLLLSGPSERREIL